MTPPNLLIWNRYPDVVISITFICTAIVSSSSMGALRYSLVSNTHSIRGDSPGEWGLHLDWSYAVDIFSFQGSCMVLPSKTISCMMGTGGHFEILRFLFVAAFEARMSDDVCPEGNVHIRTKFLNQSYYLKKPRFLKMPNSVQGAWSCLGLVSIE